MDAGLNSEVTLEIVHQVDNLTVRVSAYTVAGDGPWSDPVIATFKNDGKY